MADSFLQALVAEIEQNQTKLDECQTHSKQYCTSVKVRRRICSLVWPKLLHDDSPDQLLSV